MSVYDSPNFHAEIRYYDTITIKHKDTKVFLHSHPERYPLKYDDGRISSQGIETQHAKPCHCRLTLYRPTGYWLWARRHQQPLANHSDKVTS